MRLIWKLGLMAALVMTCGMGAWAQAPKPAAKATIADVAWLADIWRLERPGFMIEERWTPPGGGAMLGVSRTIKGERLVGFEFLRIVERNGGLVYIAQPNGRPPTEFVLTAVSADSATFENPAHDFPKLIAYTRKPDGTVEARISDGGEKGQRFVFTRVASEKTQ